MFQELIASLKQISGSIFYFLKISKNLYIDRNDQIMDDFENTT